MEVTVLRILLALIVLFVPEMCFPDDYLLVMSKDNELCQHMLKKYNADLNKYGTVKYDLLDEFKKIEWAKRKKYNITGLGAKKYAGEVLISQFDINNDGKSEIVIVDKDSMLSGKTSDMLYIFEANSFDFAEEVMINENFAKKAIGVLGCAYDRKPFEGLAYKLTELPAYDLWINIRDNKPEPSYYMIGSHFSFHPFLYKEKYYTSFHQKYSYRGETEKWEVIAQYSKDNSLKDICYFIKCCTSIAQ